MERSTIKKDVPCLAEVAKLTDTQKQLMATLFQDGKVFMTTPGTPKDNVKFLQDNVAKILADKAFQEKAKTMLEGIWTGWESGESLTKKTAGLVAAKPAMALWAPLTAKYVK
jgi:tripartite-type tricarboxylate transporter receptor subunit TctC